MSPSRYPPKVRCLAAVAIMAVAAAGGGLPMCVSLFARATQPCDMHADHAASKAHHVPATVNAASGDGHCHSDAQSSCAAGGSCPSGGASAVLYGVQAPGVAAPDHSLVFAAPTPHLSFVAPPLPPPPQA